MVNPDLNVRPVDRVRIVLVNGDGMMHDLYLADFAASAPRVSKLGEQSEVTFEAGDMLPGVYAYYCTLPGHRQAGQEGKLIVVETDLEK